MKLDEKILQENIDRRLRDFGIDRTALLSFSSLGGLQQMALSWLSELEERIKKLEPPTLT